MLLLCGELLQPLQLNPRRKITWFAAPIYAAASTVQFAAALAARAVEDAATAADIINQYLQALQFRVATAMRKQLLIGSNEPCACMHMAMHMQNQPMCGTASHILLTLPQTQRSQFVLTLINRETGKSGIGMTAMRDSTLRWKKSVLAGL